MVVPRASARGRLVGTAATRCFCQSGTVSLLASSPVSPLKQMLGPVPRFGGRSRMVVSQGLTLVWEAWWRRVPSKTETHRRVWRFKGRSTLGLLPHSTLKMWLGLGEGP